MTHSRVSGTIKEQPRGTIPSTPTAPFRGDGGLYSTVDDYGMFMRMLLNGGQLGAAQDSQRAVGADDGREPHRLDFRRAAARRRPLRTKPFPLGAGHDKFGLGFQIASKDDPLREIPQPGSMSWAGIFNTEFWIDPVRHIGGVQMMQVLPFYDDGAIRTLRDFESAGVSGAEVVAITRTEVWLRPWLKPSNSQQWQYGVRVSRHAPGRLGSRRPGDPGMVGTRFRHQGDGRSPRRRRVRRARARSLSR